MWYKKILLFTVITILFLPSSGCLEDEHKTTITFQLIIQFSENNTDEGSIEIPVYDWFYDVSVINKSIENGEASIKNRNNISFLVINFSGIININISREYSENFDHKKYFPYILSDSFFSLDDANVSGNNVNGMATYIFLNFSENVTLIYDSEYLNTGANEDKINHEICPGWNLIPYSVNSET